MLAKLLFSDDVPNLAVPFHCLQILASSWPGEFKRSSVFKKIFTPGIIVFKVFCPCLNTYQYSYEIHMCSVSSSWQKSHLCQSNIMNGDGLRRAARGVVYGPVRQQPVAHLAVPLGGVVGHVVRGEEVLTHGVNCGDEPVAGTSRRSSMVPILP